jgi:hypothetical protein
LFVVDVDPRHGGDESLARLVSDHDRLPATRTTGTRSGGRHLWFGTAEQVRQDQSGQCLGPGLDTRVHGRGYVIVPPSRGYIWLDKRLIAQAPGWLVDRLRAAPPMAVRQPLTTRHRGSRYVDAAVRDECDSVRTCPIGAGVRNVTLHRAACRLGQLVGAGLLQEDRAKRELLAATSLPEREAAATIISGLGWGRDHPRDVTAVREEGRETAASHGRKTEKAVDPFASPAADRPVDCNAVLLGQWPEELLDAGGLDRISRHDLDAHMDI